MKVIYQLSYKYDEFPEGVEVVDCRAIKNPYNSRLSNEQMIRIVRTDKRFEELVRDGVRKLKTNPSLVVACSYGKHRSRAVAEEIYKRISKTYPGLVLMIKSLR